MNDIRRNSSPLKIEKCYYCNTRIGTDKIHSLCKSHSIPQHSLRQISQTGRLRSINSFIKMPGMPVITGVKESGTFKLICRKCDSTIFTEYENFNNFNEGFQDLYWDTKIQKILNQIVIKNNLHSLYNELTSLNHLRGALQRRQALAHMDENTRVQYFGSSIQAGEANVRAYTNQFNAARKMADRRNLHNKYFVGFYRRLPYTLPLAFQGTITPQQSPDGTVINNNYSKEKLHDLNICIFPHSSGTILIVFSRSGINIFKDIYNELTGLDNVNAAKALIALSLNYSCNLYISDSLKMDECSQEYDYLRRLASYDGTQRIELQHNEYIPNPIAQQLVAETSALHFPEKPIYADYHLIPDYLAR